MILQSSQRLPELLFYTKKSYKILQLQFQLQFQLQSYTCTVQRILHAEDNELFEYYNPVAPETFQTFQSFMTFQPSRQFYNVPVSPGNPPHSSILRLECIFYIFYNSTVSTVRLVSTENSTEYQLGNYRHYKHSFFKEREMLRYRSRCQDDIFPRIELIPSFVLSSDNTNCKNDIQLFHQLFDELSVYRDYH